MGPFYLINTHKVSKKYFLIENIHNKLSKQSISEIFYTYWIPLFHLLDIFAEKFTAYTFSKICIVYEKKTPMFVIMKKYALLIYVHIKNYPRASTLVWTEKMTMYDFFSFESCCIRSAWHACSVLQFTPAKN